MITIYTWSIIIDENHHIGNCVEGSVEKLEGAKIYTPYISQNTVKLQKLETAVCLLTDGWSDFSIVS